MSLDIYLAYVLARLVIAVIPGPTVTVIIANSLSWARAPAYSTSPASGQASRS